MSDEENEHEHRHVILPGLAAFMQQPDPEEVKRASMETDALFMRINDLFGRLSQEDLETVRALLAICTGSEGGHGERLLGIIAGFLSIRFNICLGCGQNHFDTGSLEVPDGEAPTQP